MKRHQETQDFVEVNLEMTGKEIQRKPKSPKILPKIPVECDTSAKSKSLAFGQKLPWISTLPRFASTPYSIPVG